MFPVESDPNWMDMIMSFLMDETIPTDRENREK